MGGIKVKRRKQLFAMILVSGRFWILRADMEKDVALAKSPLEKCLCPAAGIGEARPIVVDRSPFAFEEDLPLGRHHIGEDHGVSRAA